MKTPFFASFSQKSPVFDTLLEKVSNLLTFFCSFTIFDQKLQFLPEKL